MMVNVKRPTPLPLSAFTTETGSPTTASSSASIVALPSENRIGSVGAPEYCNRYEPPVTDALADTVTVWTSSTRPPTRSKVPPISFPSTERPWQSPAEEPFEQTSMVALCPVRPAPFGVRTGKEPWLTSDVNVINQTKPPCSVSSVCTTSTVSTAGRLSNASCISSSDASHGSATVTAPSKSRVKLPLISLPSVTVVNCTSEPVPVKALEPRLICGRSFSSDRNVTNQV